MERKVVKILYVINILFLTGVMLIAITRLILYNDIFTLFIFKTIQIENYEIREQEGLEEDNDTDEKRIIINYSFSVENKSYDTETDIGEISFKKDFKILTNGKVEINYNTRFPQFSCIAALRCEHYLEQVTIEVCVWFIFILTIIYIFPIIWRRSPTGRSF